MDVEVTLGARVVVTTATTPLPIVFVLIPVARHMYEPGELAQERPFAAAIAAGPGATEMDTISAGLYDNVHCRPAGCLPVGVKNRFKEADPPGEIDAEDKVNVPGWPNED